jgi:carboxyl-terminal processing protease
VARRLAPLALLLAGGCSVSGFIGGDETFDSQAEAQFSKGYIQISERYIDDVALGGIAIDGLNGLTQIDPHVIVTRDGDLITISNNDDRLGAFPAPLDDDPTAWAELTVAAVKLGFGASPTLSAADKESIYEVIFDGALAGLDGFSRYSPAEQAREERARRVGFGGIGIRIKMLDERPSIVSVIPDTPAEAAGLKNKDLITHVNSQPVDGLTLPAIIDLLRGPIGGYVDVAVERAGRVEPIDVTLRRERITPPSVTTRREGDILYIRISMFNHDTAHSLARQVDIDSGGAEDAPSGIVLDLRDNPGGLLDQAIKVADLFLESGEILATRGRHPDSYQYFDAKDGDIANGLPIAILVNGNTASASEILAAALQDHNRGVVIGTNSYGKGTVQTVVRMPNQGELILTWSRIYTPSGYILHQLGVMPTLCTSGTTEGSVAVIETLRRTSEETAELLSRWRTISTPDDPMTEDLRSHCPSNGAAPEVDLEVARRVLADPGLYKRNLSLSHVEIAKR